MTRMGHSINFMVDIVFDGAWIAGVYKSTQHMHLNTLLVYQILVFCVLV